jgi:two-component system cell cycle response regulator CpdR
MSQILIAEDDPSMRHFLKLALERAGHDVSIAEDGLAALNLLQAENASFDLLLADIIMPGMDGIELSQKATALDPAIKVMFITGFAAVAMGQDPDKNVAAKIMTKPFHLNDLVDQVEKLLAA